MRSWRVSLLILGSLFLGLNLILPVESCGYLPTYLDEYSSFFQSNLAHDPIFARYYYDHENQRHSYQMDEDTQQAQADSNLLEWQRYFGEASQPKPWINWFIRCL